MMMQNIKTEKLVESFIKRPSSSLILVGHTNESTKNIVEYIKSKLLKNDKTKHNILQIEPEENKNISVEQVRELNMSLNTLVKSDEKIARIAVVWNTDSATVEAQNALLKLVEEPASQTLIILHVRNKLGLLTTINSRCQTIQVLPLSRTQAVDIAKTYGKSEQEADKAYLLSDGDAVSLVKILAGDSLDIDNLVKTSKEFINQNPANRICSQKEFDSKEKIITLIDTIEKIASAGLRTSKNETTLNRWIKVIKEVRICRKLIQKNVSTKLIYTRLCVCV